MDLKELHTILDSVVERRLGKAIQQLENHLYAYPHPQAADQLERVKSDYMLMTGYWQQGYDDPERGQVYDRLLRRMYVLTTNVCIRHYIKNSSFVMGVYNRTRNGSRREWQPASLQRDMEAFVAGAALLELEPEHTREAKRQELYGQHLQMMSELFDYIWTSMLWTDGVTDAFEQILLSPTIDSSDQQLLISAITLSLINYFGINKFRLLVNVYLKATDERVRQRALIGWVLCLNTKAAALYREMYDLIGTVTADERCCSELSELQMQLVYCLRAESDNHIIQNEIMPELLKSGSIRVTRNGIEEVEDDPMEDVLHPEASEQRMEHLEEVMRRMVEMQKQGSDIYFGGFSQMKRFPFFSTVSNWFVPFSLSHPAVCTILGKARGGKFLRRLLASGPFCDSDKYSFVLGFEMAVSRLPESLMQMLDRGEATLAGVGEMSSGDMDKPEYLRRCYLQNLYRFFKVFPQRSEFRNPFETKESARLFFFSNPIFRETPLHRRFGQVASFFLKQKAYEAARLTLENYAPSQRDAQFYLMNGSVMAHLHCEQSAGLTMRENYARLVEMAPDNERGWTGYARALFADGDYEQARMYYDKLLEKHPGHLNNQLNAAVCLTNMKQYDEALKILFKLNYEAPDNLNVNRVLAWALVGACKYEQATKMYDSLLSVPEPVSEDLLNAAYCHWFGNDVAGAVNLFRQYGKCEGVSFDPYREFLIEEASMIAEHGIGETEIRLMSDLLFSL